MAIIRKGRCASTSERGREAMNDRAEFGLLTGFLAGLVMAVGAVVVILAAFWVWHFF